MPRIDGNGPEGKGPQTGRKLGTCTSNQGKDASLYGKGQGKRRNSDGGQGRGRRLQYNSPKLNK